MASDAAMPASTALPAATVPQAPPASAVASSAAIRYAAACSTRSRASPAPHDATRRLGVSASPPAGALDASERGMRTELRSARSRLVEPHRLGAHPAPRLGGVRRDPIRRSGPDCRSTLVL